LPSDVLGARYVCACAAKEKQWNANRANRRFLISYVYTENGNFEIGQILAQLSLDQKLNTLAHDLTRRMPMTRRELLRSLPAWGLEPPFFAQVTKATITAKALNQFTLLVSDVKRSMDFYQGLFGMPVQARKGSTVLLRIGNGPQFMAIGPAGSDPPSIAPAVGMSVENFDANRVVAVLAQHGITKVVPEGTQEISFTDPDGLVVRLTDTKYCGCTGKLSEVCTNVEPSPKKGLIAVKDLNHFTINEADGARSNAFYQELFGLQIRSRQGAAQGLGIGPGAMFVMFAGGGARGGTPRPAS